MNQLLIVNALLSKSFMPLGLRFQRVKQGFKGQCLIINQTLFVSYKKIRPVEYVRPQIFY
jgi:hypothetical protein